MAAQAWSHWAVKPFEDTDYEENSFKENAEDINEV